MRADRLLSIMLLLQVHRRLTARQLAERLEVSERTIYRDMEALSGAGVPVLAERGAGGGWALLNDYETDLTGLTRAEIEALFVAQPARLLADLGLEKASEAALLKLLAALPAIYRQDAESLRQRIHIDTTGWRGTEEAAPWLGVIQEAVWRERRLRFTYRRGDECPVERVVDPLGLVAKGSAWYLVAGIDGDIRSYRVSRIHQAELLDEPAARPPCFDLAAHWQQAAKDFRSRLPRYLATMRIAPELLPRFSALLKFASVETQEAPDADGWTRMTIRFQFEEEACEFALGYGPRVEVVEPAGLRDRVIEAARATLAFYEQGRRADRARIKRMQADSRG